MATRSVTVFEDEHGDPEVTVYRHWDGEPAVAGLDLLTFLQADRDALRGSRIGDVPYLAARYVAFLADIAGDGGGPADFLGVGIIPNGSDWGQEYTYTVAHDGRATVEVEGHVTRLEHLRPG